MHSLRAITFDDTHIVLRYKPCAGEDQVERISWEDVERIYAYKKDCLAVDQIRMELMDKTGKGVLITEEMPGWEALVEVLPRRLPGCVQFEQWFQGVAVPAFARNLTLLYERNTKLEESSS